MDAIVAPPTAGVLADVEIAADLFEIGGAERTNPKWIADFTYLWTTEVWLMWPQRLVRAIS